MKKSIRKMNDKGFSLVELIIVIAIMAILIGVLAPQFAKYVEQSRRSTDIQNAENIKNAILADIADGEITGSGTAVAVNGQTGGLTVTTITQYPVVAGSGTGVNGTHFTATYDAVNGTCEVSAGSAVLTNPTVAADYKDGTIDGSAAGGSGGAGGGAS